MVCLCGMCGDCVSVHVMYVCMGVFVWYIFEVCVCMSVASVYMCVLYMVPVYSAGE